MSRISSPVASTSLLICSLSLTYLHYASCSPSTNDSLLRFEETVDLGNENAEQKNRNTNRSRSPTSLIFDERSPELDTSLLDGFGEAGPIAKFNTSQSSLQVIDVAIRTWDGKLIVQRLIINPVRPDLYISQAFLKVPPNFNKTLDTTKLPVDYAMSGGYWAILASPPFIIGSLSNDSGNAVVVGLGAGQLNNFLHYHFPKVNITAIEIEPSFAQVAKKYFGFQEDATQRLLIMDGLKFLEDAASEETKYDAIYIDACPSAYNKGDEVLCPGEAFLNASNIMNMKQALSETGTIVIKMLLMTEDVTEKAVQLSEPYRQVFGNCALLPLVKLSNRMLICAGKAINKLDVERLWNEVATFQARLFEKSSPDG